MLDLREQHQIGSFASQISTRKFFFFCKRFNLQYECSNPCDPGGKVRQRRGKVERSKAKCVSTLSYIVYWHLVFWVITINKSQIQSAKSTDK